MIYIIIPVLNRWHFTKECLLSLKHQTFRDFKTIVVDHGSTDGTTKFIQTDFSEVIVLKGDESMWWTDGTNLGIKYVIDFLNPDLDDYILTLNNDLVVRNDYLSTILSCAEENEDSIVGSVSVDINSPNTVSFCGVSWNQYTAKYTNKIKIYGTDFSLLKVNRKIIASDLLPGRGTLFPMSSFSRYGLFDNFNFPHYAADEDFTLHLKRNGYSLLICVNAVVLSHINDTGIKKSKSNLERLTSIRSPTNIRIRYLWAKKNAPLPYLYFVCELSRILYSIYIKSYIKSN